MNEYDSSKMIDILRKSHGYELTTYENEADLLLLNTYIKIMIKRQQEYY